ncbi:hypothetical protein B296_00042858 [Ensete ventricosum]|uniref:Uncharacterized protein n=1 Tax=Ensete ventricosum TaxID=4639 RepID=A0A426Y5D2_ENSVE|nr:hypothetical protein B296_00042858 [Ensete ventricosum]
MTDLLCAGDVPQRMVSSSTVQSPSCLGDQERSYSDKARIACDLPVHDLRKKAFDHRDAPSRTNFSCLP